MLYRNWKLNTYENKNFSPEINSQQVGLNLLGAYS